MPDQDMNARGSKKYPALDQMSTEDLKHLLVHELDALDDVEPDIAFLDAIWEVIEEREAGTEDALQVDVAAAWRQLQERIAMGLDDEIITPPEPHRANVKKRPRYSWILRGVAAIVIVFLAVCGTASVFGVNMFQTVAQWTSETFHFTLQSNSDPAQPDPYAELRSEVAELTDVPVLPNWAPKETSMDPDLQSMEYVDNTYFLATFFTERGVFTVGIRVYNGWPSEFSGTYQKDDREVVIVEAGGVTHYIVHNNAKCGVIWMNGLVEASIQGDLTVEELEKMVRSIYE